MMLYTPRNSTRALLEAVMIRIARISSMFFVLFNEDRESDEIASCTFAKMLRQTRYTADHILHRFIVSCGHMCCCSKRLQQLPLLLPITTAATTVV
jgi:hypothetical protein